MEAAKMSRALIIFVLSLSILNMANCDETEDRHFCQQSFTVSYTEEVPKQMEEFGDFKKYFEELKIPGGTKIVTKTRLEDKLVCCPGYIISDGGECVQLQTTTTDETTSEESQTSTEEEDLNQQTQDGYIPYLLYAALAIGTLIIIGAVVCFFRKRTINHNGIYNVNYEAGIQKAFI